MKKLVFLFLILFFSACHQDSDVFVPDPQLPIELVTTSIGGAVIDENNVPVEGAWVTIGTESKETDKNGVFIFREVDVDKTRAYVKVAKAGYFNGSRAFIPNERALHSVRVKLLAAEEIGTIAATTGGEIALPSGAVIDFPEASIANYEGTVHVAAKYLDATRDDLNQVMPGDLTGLNTNDEEQMLTSFGMLAVELPSDNGELLNLANGKEAIITIPIAQSLQTNAANYPTIPLWHFDEITGIWKEEGSATLQNGAYTGSVSHFSYWNCDAPFPIVPFSGRVIDDNGEPLANIRVEITHLANSTIRAGFTDDTGLFAGKIPANEDLFLAIKNECGNNAVGLDIAPSNSAVSIPDITLSDENQLINLSGTLLDCNNAPIQEGYIKVTTGQSFQIFFIENGGIVSGEIINCPGNNVLEVIAFDAQSLKQSLPFVYNATGSIDLGNLLACEELEEFISYTYDSEDRLHTTVASFTEGDFVSLSGQFEEQLIQVDFFGPEIGNYEATQVRVDSVFGPEPNVTINISAFGQVGEPIIGTFTGDFEDEITNENHTVNGSFRIIRDN